jgi:hypothetical protein
MQAEPQVVFIDVLIVGRLDVGSQSFPHIGLHKIDAASDWLLIKWHCIVMKGLPGGQKQNYSDNSSYRRDFSIYQREDVLFQLKIRAASEKFKNQPQRLLRPTSVNLRQHCRNLSHETVPLKGLGHEKAFKYLDKNNYVFIGLNKNPFWFLNFRNAPLMRCRHCHLKNEILSRDPLPLRASAYRRH